MKFNLSKICIFNFQLCRQKKNKMIKQVNWVLSKGQSQAVQQHSQRVIKTEDEQLHISRAVSTKTINMRKKEEEYVVKQLTKEQKIAAMILKNILRQNLRKTFKRMLSRLVIKKIAYKLLTSKRKRDLEAAFLAIKTYRIKSQHSSLHTFFLKHTELRILALLIRKKERQNIESSFHVIKNLSIRVNKIGLFLNALDESVNRCIKRLYYSHFFDKLRQLDVLHYSQSIRMFDMVKIDSIRTRNLEREGFNKILDSILIGQCQNTSSIRKNKHEEFTSMNATKKQQLVHIREQLKAIKVNMDQEKLNKNRVFQQRKKFNNAYKAEKIEVTRKFEKDFKQEQIKTKDIQEIYNIRERVMNARDRLKLNSAGSQELCLHLIRSLSAYGERIKNLAQILPDIDSQLANFKQSELFLLKTNSLLQRLIDIYEKREPYNYQSEYYELQYENNVIRAMISCFIRQQQYDAINHLKKSRSQSQID